MSLRRKLLAHIDQYPDAAYYTLRYRQNDNNVIMRLRAWGSKVEVLFPRELRQSMKQDIEQTWQLYQHPLDSLTSLSYKGDKTHD
ncbi:MAG: TIGR03985 family CRISPR-associated protein [Moorea sp. SIOASIH]|uniref:TIGR03985 family CRISPR-associated protein n=1 Tax=Moorena sp. SIOASIH TaxID=2607817 RepID=UPI0013BCE2E6|nr:TIGR03985 family CRISPR-associated protein [Moorena sp. SIOASIH]NEO41129.1 TIGR03985 family CRISPR-associated protein [Moorena sp. SIOASIH]